MAIYKLKVLILKYPDSGKMFQERLKKIINNKAKIMSESQLVKNSEH